MRKISIAACLGLGLFALAFRAEAVPVYGWLYISPATCSNTGGTLLSGGDLRLVSGGFATCQIRLPQGVTMIGARVFMSAGQSTFTIQSTSYADPLRPATVAQWSGAFVSDWVRSPAFSGVIDNQNFAYLINLSVTSDAFAGNHYALIEITYTN